LKFSNKKIFKNERNREQRKKQVGAKITLKNRRRKFSMKTKLMTTRFNGFLSSKGKNAIFTYFFSTIFVFVT